MEEQVISKKRVADHGEVLTGKREVNAMLDLVKQETQRIDSRFLEPACGTGNFLTEILKRKLAVVEKRYGKAQLDFERYAVLAVTSIYGIDILEDNVRQCRERLFEVFDATYVQLFKDKTKEACRAAVRFILERNIVWGDALDLKSKTEPRAPIVSIGAQEVFNIKFDVIIGNPPYQLSDAGDSTGSSPIYNRFVEQAKKLNPRYLSMIIPSRWFAGGKGLDDFRDAMLRDHRISHLVDYPIASDVFPGVRVIGGVCFFLWECDYKGPCQVTTHMNDKTDTMTRPLDEFDTFVRFNKAISILKKVTSKKYPSMSNQVSRQKPFGLRTFIKPEKHGGVTLYANKAVGKIDKSEIAAGTEMLNKWKVLISMGYGEGGEAREYPRMIIGKPIIAAPPSACTETYLVVGAYDSKNKAANLAAYLRTRFFRLLVGLRKNTQHITKDRFAFVPLLPMKTKWTDKKLYEHFSLTKDEIAFIESMVRPMPAADGKAGGEASDE